jgi:hypothetical protein
MKHVNAEIIAPPALNGDFVYGQFVKDRFVGMMVKIEGEKYLALCPDGKCYPKGKKYETGHWYKLSGIKAVTGEEKEEFLFKLGPRHTPEEYLARYELTKAGWRGRGLEAEVKRFETFFDRVLSRIDGKPGVNWGARLKTVFPPDPTLNLAGNSDKDFQANMFCFFSLSADAKTGGKRLSVFIKEWKWIPETERIHFPRQGDGKFYPPGHCTAFDLDATDEAGLMRAADSLAAVYRAADKTPDRKCGVRPRAVKQGPS